MKIDKNKLEASVYCNTWTYYYTGWRRVVARLYIPVPKIEFEFWFARYNPIKKYLKQEKERLFYQAGDKTVCSFENYDFIMKNDEFSN